MSTATDLLNDLGMKAVTAPETKTSVRPESPVTPSNRKGVLVALLSSAILMTGFKVIGDYACERAIDAWATKKQAQFTSPSPVALAFFDKFANEPEITEGTTAQDAPVAAEPVSANTGG